MDQHRDITIEDWTYKVPKDGIYSVRMELISFGGGDDDGDPKCQCGALSINSTRHSHWCSMYKEIV